MYLAIFLVVVAQFLNAVIALVDKYIISTKKVPSPAYYAFFVSILSALSIFVFLFSFIPIPIPELAIPSISNVGIPSLAIIVLSLCAGVAFFFALWSLFSALRRADASDVIPVVGSTSALIALPLSHYILGFSISQDFLLGIFLLIIGALLLSHYRFKLQVFLVTLTAGFFFALHFVFLKYLFTITPFDNAFFWSRMGIVLAALAIFLPRWTYCKDCSRKTTSRSVVLIVGNKIMAGVAGFILLKAIDLSDVSLVQSLGGLQFVFLFVIGLSICHLLPQECGETATRKYKIQKTVAISLLVLGFLFLFL
jgi:drug/metabolite transporter (DMT)-like permease